MGDPIFEALWKRVTDAWDDDAAHGAFLRHSQDTGQLAEAASRYAGMKGDRDRGAVAKKRLEAVSILALGALEASRTEPSRGAPAWLVWLTFVTFGGAAIYLVTRLLSI